MSKVPTQFDWSATESAPKHYPMEVISGTFIFKGEDNQGMYIPSGGTLSSGWGNPISDHAGTPSLKTLPDRLKITFFSYAEKQFYQGDFDLPYDAILKVFQQGVADNNEMPSYVKVMAGIAPGGIVSVWCTGRKTAEVFFGQAEKVDLDPSSAFDLPLQSAEEADEYMQEGLEEEITPEELETLKKDGIPFGLWQRYRKQYHWMPTFTTPLPIEKIKFIHLNGETDKAPIFSSKPLENSLRNIPIYMSFHTEKYIYILDFDDVEILEAFEKLSSNDKLTDEERFIRMEFDLAYPRSKSRVRLYNAEESIELHKVIFKDW